MSAMKEENTSNDKFQLLAIKTERNRAAFYLKQYLFYLLNKTAKFHIVLIMFKDKHQMVSTIKVGYKTQRVRTFNTYGTKQLPCPFDSKNFFFNQ